MTHAPHLLASTFNVVIDKGKIAGIGTHEELVATSTDLPRVARRGPESAGSALIGHGTHGGRRGGWTRVHADERSYLGPDPLGFTWRGAALAFSLALATPACGAVTAGVVVGKVGHELSGHAHAVPQGGEVCVLQEALVAPVAGGVEKPTSEACNKAFKHDQLWRRSLVVLGAYGDTLETIALGASSDTTGQLEAATTGVHGADWIDVDGAPEIAARDAVVQIVTQMRTGTAQGDFQGGAGRGAPREDAV